MVDTAVDREGILDSSVEKGQQLIYFLHPILITVLKDLFLLT